jgi:hypothetical protein
MTIPYVYTRLQGSRRIVRPSGWALFTGLVEERAPSTSFDPPDHNRCSDGSLHCIQFDSRFLEEGIRSPIIELNEPHDAPGPDRQHAVELRRAILDPHR